MIANTARGEIEVEIAGRKRKLRFLTQEKRLIEQKLMRTMGVTLTDVLTKGSEGAAKYFRSGEISDVFGPLGYNFIVISVFVGSMHENKRLTEPEVEQWIEKHEDETGTLGLGTLSLSILSCMLKAMPASKKAADASDEDAENPSQPSI